MVAGPYSMYKLEACSRIEAGIEYLTRVLAKVRENARTLESMGGGPLRYEVRILEGIGAQVERAIHVIRRLKALVCEGGMPPAPIVERELSGLYLLAASSPVPLPSNVKAVIYEVYSAVEKLLERGQRPKASS